MFHKKSHHNDKWIKQSLMIMQSRKMIILQLTKQGVHPIITTITVASSWQGKDQKLQNKITGVPEAIVGSGNIPNTRLFNLFSSMQSQHKVRISKNWTWF